MASGLYRTTQSSAIGNSFRGPGAFCYCYETSAVMKFTTACYCETGPSQVLGEREGNQKLLSDHQVTGSFNILFNLIFTIDLQSRYLFVFQYYR